MALNRNGLQQRALEVLRRYRASLVMGVFAGLTAGIILGFRIVAPFIFS